MCFRKQLFVLLLLSFIPVITVATEFMAKDGVIISGSEVIEDDLYLFGNYAEVYGKVDGDLAAFCYDIKSEGEIAGNVDLFAYNIDLAGDVEKSCRLFGYKIDIAGRIGRNILAFGRSINIENEAVIGRDLTCAGERIIINGAIWGNADVAGDIVTISGTIEGDAEIEAEEISIISPAVIKGDLLYTSREKAYIDDGVIIEGETEWNLPKSARDEDEEDDGGISAFGFILRSLLFFMALITGLALILIFRNHTYESTVQIEKRFWHTLAIGFLAFIIFTGGALILLVLIVGIPLSILSVTAGMVLFYIGKIYVSIVLGRLVFSLLARGRKFALGWELLIGLIILSLLFQVPVFGIIIYLLAFILGTGAAITGYYSLNRKYKEAMSGSPS